MTAFGQSMMHSSRRWAWIVLAIAAALAVICIIALLRRSQEPRVAAVAGVPGDDASILLTRCGPADSQNSTAYDDPRPLVPNLKIAYTKAKVQAVFLPGTDVSEGDAPPYHWKLLGFADAADEHNVLTKEEARRRLSCAKTLLAE
jgi:hypothetical protein